MKVKELKRILEKLPEEAELRYISGRQLFAINEVMKSKTAIADYLLVGMANGMTEKLTGAKIS